VLDCAALQQSARHEVGVLGLPDQLLAQWACGTAPEPNVNAVCMVAVLRGEHRQQDKYRADWKTCCTDSLGLHVSSFSS